MRFLSGLLAVWGIVVGLLITGCDRARPAPPPRPSDPFPFAQLTGLLRDEDLGKLGLQRRPGASSPWFAGTQDSGVTPDGRSHGYRCYLGNSYQTDLWFDLWGCDTVKSAQELQALKQAGAGNEDVRRLLGEDSHASSGKTGEVSWVWLAFRVDRYVVITSVEGKGLSPSQMEERKEELLRRFAPMVRQRLETLKTGGP